MEPIYRAALLIRRRDGGIETIGTAMDAAELQRIIEAARWADDPDPGRYLYILINKILTGKVRPRPLEVSGAIIQVAEHQRLIIPGVRTIVLYQPLAMAPQLYICDREIDHQDGIEMLKIADQCDGLLRQQSEKSSPSPTPSSA
jgi:hypothetical protein